MRTSDLRFKLKVYGGIVVLLLAVLCLKLAVVQLFYSDIYQTKAKENRLRLVSIKASRGEIYDRNGTILAANQLVYILTMTNPGESDQEDIIARLVSVLKPYFPEVTADYIKEKIELQKFRQYEPVTILRDIPWELVVKIEENRHDLPGITVDIEPLRYYPRDNLAGHVLGYIHSINQDELAADGAQYNMNSLVGKSGLEKQYEAQLRGTDGARRVEVDAQGRPVGELVTLDPVAGNNLTLTLDEKLQVVMEYSMASNLTRLQRQYPKARVGSAVLMDVKNGEILAMCSSPALRPDDWKGNISSKLANYYFPQRSSYNPLEPGAATNRAIQANYPPGSTFKPITGMAALEAGVMDPLKDYVNCQGRYWIAPYIPCTGVHGNVNYYSAMATSCNTYFQEMGRRATQENLVKVAKDFGLGAKTGIDLPYEIQGSVPTPEWKRELNDLLINRKYDSLRKQLEEKYIRLLAAASSQDAIQELNKKKQQEQSQLEAQYEIDYNFDTQWQAFDTFNMSIGQGGNQYTVIEMVDYIAAVANGGSLMRPRIVKRITSPDQDLLQEIAPEVIRTVSVSTRTLAETRRAMVQVTQKDGTAAFLFSSFPDNIKVGAKTGTAQTNRVGDDALHEFHGVFVAFAPAENPAIAFAGVIEYGQHGSESVGYVAKDVFEQYFGLQDHYTVAAQAKTY
ncbi:MAG: penicillin-binding transpeptidase domain-containing protein [Syntrophomonadaceae bacterium]